jgi:hypothetical protein
MTVMLTLNIDEYCIYVLLPDTESLFFILDDKKDLKSALSSCVCLKTPPTPQFLLALDIFNSFKAA